MAMNYAVSPLIESVHFPPISEVRRWLNERPADCEMPLIDLCQAVPDYPPAPELVAHLSSVLTDPMTSRYSPDEGLPEVLEAVCQRYRKRYGALINPSQVCLSIGASQAFWLAMITLCQSGDNVVVQTPYYFDHDMALAMLGIGRMYAPFDEATGGLPSPGAIAGLITPRTKAILIVTPSNPAGTVTPPELIAELYRLAADKGIALILDETYADFLPVDEAPHRLFTDATWGSHLIHLMSFGKTYALTGYRAGLLAAGEQFIHHALKAQDTMAVCQPRITQKAIQFGVEHLDSWVAGNRLMMASRHERFRNEFIRSGIQFKLVTSGTFFAWIRHPFTGRSGREVAKKLALEHGILSLPGEVFGPGMEGYLRLAFGNIKEEAIPEAVARFSAITPEW